MRTMIENKQFVHLTDSTEVCNFEDDTTFLLLKKMYTF